MNCEQVMKTDVQCVTPETTIEEAAARMRDEGVGFLPVCDSTGRVLGTLTDRDIAIRAVATGESLSQPVENIMTREVIGCRSTEDLTRAEDLMREAKVSRIMCTDELGILEGIISLSDIAQIEGRRASQTLREVSDREARP